MKKSYDEKYTKGTEVLKKRKLGLVFYKPNGRSAYKITKRLQVLDVKTNKVKSVWFAQTLNRIGYFLDSDRGYDHIEVTYIDHMGSDLSVVNAARVSFGKKSEWEKSEPLGCINWPNCSEVGCHDDYYEELSERDTKLIKYLAKHKHISPFGHAFASFHVKAPVFVARQLVERNQQKVCG